MSRCEQHTIVQYPRGCYECDCEAELARLRAENERLTRERDTKTDALRHAIAREEDANRNWSADVKKYRSRLAAAESERDALKEALGPFIAPTGDLAALLFVAWQDVDEAPEEVEPVLKAIEAARALLSPPGAGGER